jgi:hypothetical protein
MDVFSAPGLWVLPRLDLDELIEAATAHDAISVLLVISVNDIASKVGLLERLAEACEAPGYARPNWDSFDEWLRDLSWLPLGGRLIVLAGTDHYRLSDADGWSTLLAIATDAVSLHAAGPAPLWLVAVGRV